MLNKEYETAINLLRTLQRFNNQGADVIQKNFLVIAILHPEIMRVPLINI